jgi:hypothetical protein
MNAREAIRSSMNMSDMICNGYLEDMTDAELLVRPVPGANHIAWQLGHLINSEHSMLETAFPGSMPALPAGFAEKYKPETSTIDDPKAFHTKAEYLKLRAEQRAATLKTLEKLSDADLDKPSPEAFRSYAPNFGDLFGLHGSHGLMHAGQWAVVRRKLGRKPLF